MVFVAAAFELYEVRCCVSSGAKLVFLVFTQDAWDLSWESQDVFLGISDFQRTALHALAP